MRIVISADTYLPDVNGAASFATQLAHGMARRGHDVHVIAPSPQGVPYIAQVGDADRGVVTEHRVRSHEYPMFKGFFVAYPWETSRTVERILRGLRPDVLHTQAHFSVGRYAVKWANRLQIPLVATNHFMPENLVDHLPLPLPQVLTRSASSAAWRDLGHVFRRADRLTAPTALAVKLLHDRAKLGGGVPVSCGIDSAPYARAALECGFTFADADGSASATSAAAASDFAATAEAGEASSQSSPSSPDGQAAAHPASSTVSPNAVPTALFVGRLEQEKRVDEIIRALALLPADLPLKLEVVGQGTKLEPWQALARELGVEQRVEFLGYVDNQELLRHYGACDFFVMPGIAELQSIVTLEAMSAHKPVILADAVALPHLVRHGENGFKFTPGDVPALARYLETLARDASLRARMGEVSAEMVKVHSLDATLERFEQLYREAIEINQNLLVAKNDKAPGKTFS